MTSPDPIPFVESLPDIKAGDFVLLRNFEYFGPGPRLSKERVKKVLSKAIVLDNGARFSIATGKKIGEIRSTLFETTHIEPWDPDRHIEMIEDSRQRALRAALLQRLRDFAVRAPDHLTLERLLRIDAILQEGKSQEPGTGHLPP